MVQKYLYSLLVVILPATTVFAAGGTLICPWFIDSCASAAKLPPVKEGVETLVYIKNTDASNAATCTIAYFSNTGVVLGPSAPNNTFVVASNAVVAFRPVRYDPNTVTNGQESPTGWVVPDRPTIDGKTTGSFTVTWVIGNEKTIVGIARATQAATHPINTAIPTGTQELKIRSETWPLIHPILIADGPSGGLSFRRARNVLTREATVESPVEGSMNAALDYIQAATPVSVLSTKQEMIDAGSEVPKNVVDYTTDNLTTANSIGLELITFLRRAIGN